MMHPSRIMPNTAQRISARLITAFLFCVLQANGVTAGQTGQEIMENRCTMCHALPDPASLSKEQWGMTLEAMAGFAGLSAKEKSSILEYVTSHEQKAVTITSMAQEQKTFERKCSLCHTTNRVLLMPLTPVTRQHVVKRMQARAPDLISENDVHEILEYLNHGTPGSTRPERKTVTGGAEETFRERCTACHTAERVYLKLQQGNKTGTAIVWGHVVNRMREKAPEWITEQEAGQILEYLGSIKSVE